MHGGDIYRNKIELDFSVNINPYGFPQGAWESILDSKDKLLEYPDISCEALRKKIADCHNVTLDRVVCGNGASELIQGICFMKKAHKALLNAPSFSGYERSLGVVGTRVEYNYLNEGDFFYLTDVFADKIEASQPQLVFVTNPNNPDGNIVRKEVRKKIMDACFESGALLVVDECFIEMTDENEEASFLKDITKDINAIVLRAFTKSYGMPGLRLAYGICSNNMIAERLSDYLSEWNISTFAQAVGCKVIGDKDYLLNSRRIIKEEREYLSKELMKLNMRVNPSSANFILFEDTQKRDESLFDMLLKKGILIRDCSDYMGLKHGHYRVAVKDHNSNKKLIEAIKEES